MAGKVAQIRDIINSDSLATQLSALYNRWWIQKNGKEAEWKELRNYIFATDTTTTSNSSLPWKNKTTIPKLTQIRDNLHANYMDALFPNDDWLRWEGFSSDDVNKKKRKIIESYMKNKLRQSEFRQMISKCLYDYIDTGNVFGEAIYITEKHLDPTTGQEETTYSGPKALRISPYDHVFNPTAMSYKESPKFTRYIMGVGELMKDVLNRPELQYDESVFRKVTEVRRNLSAFRMEDINKAEGFAVDGFGTLSEYYQSGLVELIDFEGSWYNDQTGELLENRIVTIVDRTHVLRNIPNPSWLGQDTKAHVGWRDRPDNLYGMGPLDNLVGMQYRIDHLENLKADAMDLIVQPPLKIVGDVDPFTWEPFGQIHVSEDGDVVPLATNVGAVAGVNNEIGQLLALMEEMAGAPKEAMGIRTPGEKTAFEVQQLQNAAGRIFQHKINKFEIEFMEPLINSMFELAKRNLDTKDVIKVMDDDLGVAEFVNITKDDITAKGKLRPIGARHYAARAQLMQNLIGVLNSSIGQLIAPHVSAKNLASMVEDYMGFTQFDIIKDNAAIFEQADTQRLINQAQQTVGTENATPVEENMLGGQPPPPQK
jgi:hypothetical protein